jgi:hypothetical protein
MQTMTKLIKYYGDKRRTYKVIPLGWSYNMYDAHNKNYLVEYVCLLFLMCVQIISHYSF